MSISKNLRNAEYARRWVDVRPQIGDFNTINQRVAWSKDFPLFRLRTVELWLRKKTKKQALQFYARQAIGHRQWLASLPALCDGDPWERIVRKNPFRLSCTYQEVADAKRLFLLLPTIAADIERDPRAAANAPDMRHLLSRRGCWDLCSKPFGFSGISRLPELKVSGHEDSLWPAIPPEWRSMPDQDLLAKRYLPQQSARLIWPDYVAAA